MLHPKIAFVIANIPFLIILTILAAVALRSHIENTERANNKSPSSDDTAQGQIVAQSMEPQKAGDERIVVTAYPVEPQKAGDEMIVTTAYPVDPFKAEGSYDAVVVAQSMDPNEVAGPIQVAEIVEGSTPSLT